MNGRRNRKVVGRELEHYGSQTCGRSFEFSRCDELAILSLIKSVMLLESFLDWNVEGNRVHDAQALELHPDAVHAGTRKCHIELDVLPGTA